MHLNRQIHTQSAFGVHHEHLLDQREEIFGITKRNAIEFTLLYLFGKREVVAGFKGPPQCGQLVDEATSRPNVRFLVVFSITHLLRRHVIWRTNVRLRELRMLPHLSTQPKVSQFNVVSLIDENIGRFDIPVKHFSTSTALISSPRVTILKR